MLEMAPTTRDCDVPEGVIKLLGARVARIALHYSRLHLALSALPVQGLRFRSWCFAPGGGIMVLDEWFGVWSTSGGALTSGKVRPVCTATVCTATRLRTCECNACYGQAVLWSNTRSYGSVSLGPQHHCVLNSRAACDFGGNFAPGCHPWREPWRQCWRSTPECQSDHTRQSLDTALPAKHSVAKGQCLGPQSM